MTLLVYENEEGKKCRITVVVGMTNVGLVMSYCKTVQPFVIGGPIYTLIKTLRTTKKEKNVILLFIFYFV